MSKKLKEIAADAAAEWIKSSTTNHSLANACALYGYNAGFLAGYKAAQEEADSCEHILDMSKMVDVNGWISVKDRVPEKEGEYLAFGYSASNAARWVVVMYDPRDECWYELSSDWDWTDDITHWQELPKPPKEEG